MPLMLAYHMQKQRGGECSQRTWPGESNTLTDLTQRLPQLTARAGLTWPSIANLRLDEYSCLISTQGFQFLSALSFYQELILYHLF